MTHLETAPLLRAIEQEAERERREIVARAGEQARQVLEGAEEDAARILAGELSISAAPPADPLLGVRRAELLECYGDRVAELRRGVSRELEGLGDATRRDLLLGVLGEVLADLPRGVYRVAAAEELWNAIRNGAAPPPGRSLHPSPPGREEDQEGVTLTSEDGTLTTGFCLEGMVSRYFETESHRVARLLLDDESS